MKLDVETRPAASGMVEKPLFVFIHGMGLDKNIWLAPEKSRLFAGLVSFDKVVSIGPTLWQDLEAEGWPLLCWTQQRPVHTLELCLDELRHALTLTKDMDYDGLVLVGLSRGGIIARRFMEEARKAGDSEGKNRPLGLVTICTPHRGSNLARYAVHLSALAGFIESLLPGDDPGKVALALKRLLGFLGSEGVRELLPDSTLIASLDSTPPEGVRTLSVGGTDPTLVKYKNLSFPDMLLKALPRRAVYEELVAGKGDGLVTAQSARCPFSDEHHDLHVRHISAVFDQDVRRLSLKWIKKNY